MGPERFRDPTARTFGITWMSTAASIRRAAGALTARVLRGLLPRAKMAPMHRHGDVIPKEYVMSKKTPVSSPTPNAGRGHAVHDAATEAADQHEFRKTREMSARTTRLSVTNYRKKTA